MNQLKREINTNKENFYNKMHQADKQSTFLYSSICLLILTTAFASYMIWYYYSYGQWAVDGALQGFMKNIRTPWLTEIFRGITATGETIPVIIATLIIIISLGIYKKYKESLMVAFYMLGTWRLNDFLKVTIQRPRPAISLHLVETSGYSLPSGHSMNFLALVLLALYFIWIFSNNKKLKTGLTALLLSYSFLVGISRVYLSVHYFSDVITGWSIGAAWAATAVIIHRLICMRQNMQSN